MRRSDRQHRSGSTGAAGTEVAGIDVAGRSGAADAQVTGARRDRHPEGTDMGLFSGVGVALVTIFHPDGKVNPAATAEHAADLVGRGMKSVLVNGSTGEAGTLTDDER